MQYCAGFCRPQQNQYLGIPREITRTFSDRLLELCGYSLYKGIMGTSTGRAPPSCSAMGGSKSAPTRRPRSASAPRRNTERWRSGAASPRRRPSRSAWIRRCSTRWSPSSTKTLEKGELFHGAQLAVYRRGVRVLEAGGGLARVRTRVPVTPETLFVMFSATKGLAGLAMLMLYERGAFHYDEPVVKYWPEFASVVPEKRQVTIRHVMSHRAGFPLGPRWLDVDTGAIARRSGAR